MLHPKYAVQIGPTSLMPNTSDDVYSISVNMTIDNSSNSFKGWFRAGKNQEQIETGNDAEVTISLGYDDDEAKLVFKGTVDSVNLDFTRFSLNASSSISKLTIARLNRFYEKKTAGEIVKDLATSVKVELGEISDGISFPYYAIDETKNLHEHIMDLAAVCGFDVYNTNDNKLVFRRYDPDSPHSLEYGKNILTISKLANRNLGATSSVKVTGDGPAVDKAHWISKKKVEKKAPANGSSGDGNGSHPWSDLLIHLRALKGESTVSKVAEAMLEKSKYSDIVVLEVVGNPKLMLGDTVEVKKVPTRAANGSYQIRNITHTLSKSSGFTTLLTCRGVSNPS